MRIFRTLCSPIASILLLLGGLYPAAISAHSSQGLQTNLGPRRWHGQVWNSTSTNWSGYATLTSLTNPQTGSVTQVSGQWVVPTAVCARQTTYSAVWVGLDGYSDNTVEQLGTEQDCNRSRPVYSAWYEMYPKASHAVRMTVRPGDTMQAGVSYASGTTYSLSMSDLTDHQSFAITEKLAGTERQSAEWIVEAPSSFTGVLPLTQFTPVAFSHASATVLGKVGTIAGTDRVNDPITLVNSLNQPISTPSAVSPDGSSFTVTY